MSRPKAGKSRERATVRRVSDSFLHGLLEQMASNWEQARSARPDEDACTMFCTRDTETGNLVAGLMIPSGRSFSCELPPLCTLDDVCCWFGEIADHLSGDPHDFLAVTETFRSFVERHGSVEMKTLVSECFAAAPKTGRPFTPVVH